MDILLIVLFGSVPTLPGRSIWIKKASSLSWQIRASDPQILAAYDGNHIAKIPAFTLAASREALSISNTG
jgi:hypothetical protein